MNRLVMLAGILACGACGGRAGGVPGSDSGTSGGPTPSPAPSPPAGVDDDVAAVMLLSGLQLITHAGVVRSALAGDPILDGITGATILTSGPYVFVLLSRELPDGTLVEQRGALVTSDGSVLWKQSFADLRWAGEASLGNDGSLVGPTDAGFRVVRADGRSTELAGFVGMRGATTDAWLAVGPTSAKLQAENFQAGAGDYGWWKVGGGNPTPLAFAPAQTPTVIGRALVYARSDAPTRSLVIQTPEDVHVLDLPLVFNTHVPESLAEGGRWIIVPDADPAADAVWRVDLATGQSQRYAVTLPDGFTPFQACQSTARAFDAIFASPQGDLLAELRADDRAALFLSSDGAHWSQLGQPVTAIGSLPLSVAGASVALLASKEIPCYAKGPTWATPSSPALVPEATQVLRPSRGTSLVRTGAAADALFAAAFSSSGRYAALWGTPAEAGDGGDGAALSVHVVDVESGVDLEVLLASAGRPSGPAWVTAR